MAGFFGGPLAAGDQDPSNWPEMKRVGPAVPVVTGTEDKSTDIKRYDLKSFLAAVLARDPSIVSAQLDSAANDYAYHSARVSYFPRLTATGRTGYIRGASISPFFNELPGANGNGVGTNSKVKGYTDYGGGSLIVPIFEDGTFLGINTPPRAAIALAQKHLSDATVILTRDQIRYRAIDIYEQTVAAYRQRAYYNIEVKALGQLANIAQVKQPYHLVSGADVKIANAESDEAKAVSLQAQSLIQGGLIQMASLLGIADPSRIQIKAEYPDVIQDPDFNELLSKALNSHPTLMAQQAAIDQAKAQHHLDQASVLPKVEGEGTYEYGADYKPPGEDRWTANILVTLPIFDFGTNYYNIRASQKELESQIQKLYATKQELIRTIREKYNDVQNANVTYLTAQVTLDKDEFTFKKDQVLAKSGEAVTADFLDTQKAYATAAIEAETDHYQLILAYAALEEATSSAWQWAPQ